MRYRLTLEYDGGPYMGWQRQRHGRSVQQAVEEAVAAYCGAHAHVQAAGRTDSGVHALAQVAHVDIARGDPAWTVRDALNAHLRGEPVIVRAAEAVDAAFHARFDAVRRTYLYRILNRRAPPALDRGRVWQVARPLDVEAMAAAARVLVGRHDFTSFRAVRCQARSPLKTLDRLAPSRRGEHIEIVAEARSFLHHQVRNMVGALKLVGEGKWTADDVAAALAARDRAAAGPTAPSHGLYLVAVGYDQKPGAG